MVKVGLPHEWQPKNTPIENDTENVKGDQSGQDLHEIGLQVHILAK